MNDICYRCKQWRAGHGVNLLDALWPLKKPAPINIRQYFQTLSISLSPDNQYFYNQSTIGYMVAKQEEAKCLIHLK